MNGDDRYLLTGGIAALPLCTCVIALPSTNIKPTARSILLMIFVFILVISFHLFSLLHLRGSPFGGCTNVFMLGKAETAAKTRQVFISRTVRL